MKEAIRKFLFHDEGSAIVEFVALALPLFIPLFIFLNSFALKSDAQGTLTTLSREMARGFVTSENDSVAGEVAYEIFVKGANVLGYGGELAAGTLTFNIECEHLPCISPNNKIVITVNSSRSKSLVSAVEYVSPWA